MIIAGSFSSTPRGMRWACWLEALGVLLRSGMLLRSMRILSPYMASCDIDGGTSSSSTCRTTARDLSRVSEYSLLFELVRTSPLTFSSALCRSLQRGNGTLFSARHHLRNHHRQRASRPTALCRVLLAHSIWLYIVVDQFVAQTALDGDCRGRGGRE